jgi:hypothetical protein
MTPNWKLLPLLPLQTTQIAFRELENGTQESCLVTDESYLAWVAEGNTPLPAEEQL